MKPRSHPPRRRVGPALLLGLALALARTVLGQPVQIDISTSVNQIQPPILVSVSGYPAEVLSVLDFHLAVCGFKIANSGDIKFELRGKADGDLEGTLTDKNTQASLFARAFSGGSRRSQTHALADEIVRTITGRAAIGHSKLAYRRQSGTRNRYNEMVSEIMVCDFDGFEPVQLTEDATINASPDWIPGLRGLVYMSNRAGNSDIYSHDLSSGARAAIARYSGSNLSPAVSPDGTRVAMVLSRGGNAHLWVTNLDGSGAVQLTRGQVDASSPCWSPDGHTICFPSTGGGKPSLYTIPASGGSARKLNTGILNATEPDWSPDGKLIAFTQMTGGANFKVFVVPAAGGSAQEVAEGEDPSWAPNSRTLAINVRKNNDRRLRLLDVPTRQYKDLPLNSGSCSQPSWGR